MKPSGRFSYESNMYGPEPTGFKLYSESFQFAGGTSAKRCFGTMYKFLRLSLKNAYGFERMNWSSSSERRLATTPCQLGACGDCASGFSIDSIVKITSSEVSFSPSAQRR